MTKTRIALVVFILLLLPVLAYGQSSTRGNQRVNPNFEVTITANVRDAQVFVDGRLQARSTPATLTLARGTYVIRVEARGYQVWEERIVVDGTRQIRVQLRPPYATLVLEIPREFVNDSVRNPLGLIDFYIDGQLRREGRVQVDSGMHRVAIASGGLRFEGDMYFEAGMVYTLELILRLNLIQNIQAGGF